MSPHNPYLPAASTVPLTEDNEALKKAAAVQRGLSVSPPPSEPPEAINLLRQLIRDMGTVRTVLARKQIQDPDDKAQEWMLRRWESQIAQIEALLAAPPEPEAAPPQPKECSLDTLPSDGIKELLRIEQRGYAGRFAPTSGVSLDWELFQDIMRVLRAAALSSPLPSEPKPALGNNIEAFIRQRLIAGLSTLTPVSAWSDDMNEILRLVRLAASPVSAVPPIQTDEYGELPALTTLAAVTPLLEAVRDRWAAHLLQLHEPNEVGEVVCCIDDLDDILERIDYEDAPAPADAELLAIRERLQCLPDAKILDNLQSLLDDRDVAWQRVNAVTKELHQAQAENRELRKELSPGWHPIGD